jgi:hypothetical protein
MIMLDDDRLVALFDRAAASFEVPASGPDEILARAAGSTDAVPDSAGVLPGSRDGEASDEEVDDFPETGRSRRVVAVARRHRILSVAACLVVVLIAAGLIGAAVRAPATSVRSAALTAPRTAVGGGVRLPVTTTTVPAAHASGAAPFGPSNAASGSAGSSTGASANTPNQPALPSGAVGQSTKIEQTGSLNLSVSRGGVARTMTRLTALAATYQGFVASSQTQSGAGGAPYGTITLQVPVNDFSVALQQAERYGKASNVSTKATDVTGQYVDLQARLTALEASRQQYLAILSKATTIGDILSVQEQLDTIQSQIEQLQGQLQVLTSQTSYSTLTVTVGASTPPPKPNPLPESGLVQAWHSSVSGFVAGIEGVVRLAGPFLFALLCLAIVAVGGRVLWRRYQRHRL